MCRKAFSGQSSAYALLDSSEFTWVSGESSLSSYKSNNGSGLQFCNKCASTLCLTYKPLIYMVIIGLSEDDPEITLERHIFIGSKASWGIIPEGVL